MDVGETRPDSGLQSGWRVGVDIGGTAAKAGLLAPSDEFVSEIEIATPVDAPPREAVRRIARAVRELIASRPVVAVGIGCAGLVSAREGIVHVSPNLALWKDVPLARWASEDLQLPVAVVNDANAFALAEARVGAGRGRSPIVGLTIGTGVGGAIVIDGSLSGGLHGFAGEAGHTSVDVNGPRCPCGNRGCLELYVGRRPLVAMYLAKSDWERGGFVHTRCGGDRERVTPRLIAEAAIAGDTVALEVFRGAGEILGAALTNLANLIDPAAFVIGGGIAQAGDLLLAPARAVLAERAMIGRERVALVLPAALGTRAGMIGAALSARALGTAKGTG
jgi:glucokinase